MKHLEPVTSKDSLYSTILTDDQVNRWFEFLIIQSEVRKVFINDKESGMALKNLFQLRLIKKAVFILLMGSLLACYLLNDIRIISLSIIFLTLSIILSTKVNRYTASLSLELVKKDFSDQQLSQTTLYVLSESYSKKYNIPSLVDVLTVGDENLRTLIIGLVFGLMVIYPFFTFTQIVVLFTAAYLSLKFLMNSDFFYRTLK